MRVKGTPPTCRAKILTGSVRIAIMGRVRWLLTLLPPLAVVAAASCGSDNSSAGPGPGGDSGPDTTTGPGPDGGGGDGSGGGTDSPSGGDASCDGASCNVVPPGLLNPDFTTNWNPGILADTATGNPLGPDGLPVRSTICASVPAQTGDATTAIQSALDGCQG